MRKTARGYNTTIRPLSDKRKKRLPKEAKLKIKLLFRQGGKCAKCGGECDWRGWQKHELVYRSRGGDPLNEDECEVWCAVCHIDKEHRKGGI